VAAVGKLFLAEKESAQLLYVARIDLLLLRQVLLPSKKRHLQSCSVHNDTRSLLIASLGCFLCASLELCELLSYDFE